MKTTVLKTFSVYLPYKLSEAWPWLRRRTSDLGLMPLAGLNHFEQITVLSAHSFNFFLLVLSTGSGPMNMGRVR